MASPALLFDIGNVLVTFDFTRCANTLAQQSPLSTERIMAAIDPLKVPLESGQCSADTFVTQAMTAIRYGGSREDFLQAWQDIFASNEPMVRSLEALSKKLPAYLLSNTNGPHKDFLFERFPVFRHFTDGVYSHEAGCMKPGPEIYEQAIRKFDLDPAQTFYVDDLSANIHTGRELGFVSFHYDPKDHAPLDAALRQWVDEQ